MSSVQTGTGRKERGRKPLVLPGTSVLKYKIPEAYPYFISLLLGIFIEFNNTFTIL